MNMASAIGSQVKLVFRTKFPTFTPDQFNKALRDKKYTMVPAQIPNPQNPQASITVQTFSKENMNIYLAPNNQIVFQILNTRNLHEIYQEVEGILVSLNVYSPAILDIIFNSTTNFEAKVEPQKRLTSLVEARFLQGIEKNFGVKLGVFSIRLATTFPLAREGIQVILEPMGTSPKNEYYLNITYRTANMEKFNQFVRKFGNEMIRETIREAEANG